MLLRVELPQDEPDPYRQLAQAVIMQAIQDATHRYRPKSKPAKRNNEQAHLEISIFRALRFLLEDREDFRFWCEVAQLQPDVVRTILANKLSDDQTYKLIRARHPA